jgi:hypothetical protein
MTYKPSSLVQRAWNVPPQCLADLRAEPLSEPPAGVTHWWNELAFFQVACPCASKSFQILGYPHPEMEATFLCPLSVQCARCARVALVFDIEKHGYHAAIGHGRSVGRCSGDPQRWVCTQCSGVTFAAYASFSYQCDETSSRIGLEADRGGAGRAATDGTGKHREPTCLARPMASRARRLEAESVAPLGQEAAFGHEAFASEPICRPESGPSELEAL